jgi:hypothetical protein
MRVFDLSRWVAMGSASSPSHAVQSTDEAEQKTALGEFT